MGWHEPITVRGAIAAKCDATRIYVPADHEVDPAGYT
jgi:hypothetical protein